jgi:hypothetical protein
MTDEIECRRCAACGGPVGPGGQTLTPLPPRAAPRVKAAPRTRQGEDVNDDLTPVERFARAIQRRDAATPKRPNRTR